MIEARQGIRFAFEALQALGVLGDVIRQCAARRAFFTAQPRLIVRLKPGIER